MKDETLDLLEKRITDNLETMSDYDVNWYNLSDDEAKGRRQLVSETEGLIDKLALLEKEGAEAWDKQERRRIEEEKAQMMANVETSKQEIKPKRAAFEIAKVLAPVIASGILYGIYQRRMIDFEENGRITTSVGRDLHLPNIFNWK